MDEHSHLDPATAEFLTQFRKGLSSVRDISGQLDHSGKSLRARGGFSAVYVIRWVRQDAEPINVCYKELYPSASDIPEQIVLTRRTIKHLTREVKIWKDLNHPNIVELIGYAIEGRGSDMKAALVSKWCANGDIVKYLNDNPGVNRIHLIEGMANGLHYLHSRTPSIVHGDLKPPNILISDEGLAQLCDFGLSLAFSELSKSSQTTTRAKGYTTRYSSYEVLIEGKKTVKSDVYAFGCTCIYLLFNKHPFHQLDSEIRVLVAIRKRLPPRNWDKISPLERILSTCCHLQEESRPSIDYILQELRRIIETGAVTKDLFTHSLELITSSWVTMGWIVSVSMVLSWVVPSWIGSSWIAMGVTVMSLTLTRWIGLGQVTSRPTNHPFLTATIGLVTTSIALGWLTLSSVTPRWIKPTWVLTSLMAIGPIATSWIVSGRISTSLADRFILIPVVWFIITPVMSGWVTLNTIISSWIIPSWIAISLIAISLIAISLITTTVLLDTSEDLASRLVWIFGIWFAATSTVSSLDTLSTIAPSWIIPSWISMGVTAITLIAIGLLAALSEDDDVRYILVAPVWLFMTSIAACWLVLERIIPSWIVPSWFTASLIIISPIVINVIVEDLDDPGIEDLMVPGAIFLTLAYVMPGWAVLSSIMSSWIDLSWIVPGWIESSWIGAGTMSAGSAAMTWSVLGLILKDPDDDLRLSLTISVFIVPGSIVWGWLTLDRIIPSWMPSWITTSFLATSLIMASWIMSNRVSISTTDHPMWTAMSDRVSKSLGDRPMLTAAIWLVMSSAVSGWLALNRITPGWIVPNWITTNLMAISLIATIWIVLGRITMDSTGKPVLTAAIWLVITSAVTGGVALDNIPPNFIFIAWIAMSLVVTSLIAVSGFGPDQSSMSFLYRFRLVTTSWVDASSIAVIWVATTWIVSNWDVPSWVATSFTAMSCITSGWHIWRWLAVVCPP